MLKQYKLTIDEVKSKEAVIIQEWDELAMRVQKYFNMAWQYQNAIAKIDGTCNDLRVNTL